MAISFTKYINIVSSVGGGAVVAQRELIGRLITNNPLLPTKSILEFTTLDAVGFYFGTSSQEYLRAAFYFSWISKNGRQAQKISFARWTDADVAPRIYGAPITAALSAFQAITTGAFSLTMGADTHILTGLDLSGAGSFTAIATILQAAIRALSGAQWATAVVTYDSTRGSFNLVGTVAASAVISVAAPGSGVDISVLMGWRPASPTGAIWSNGALTETITDMLTASSGLSNNFGSFLFIPALNLAQTQEASAWNTAQNNLYQFMTPVSIANASAYSAGLANYAGVAVTLSPLSTEYPEQVPMMILAATNYAVKNSVQNYMFQQFNLTPSVLTTTDSDFYDSLNINYYGRTQQAGQLIDFYQTGVLTGLAANPRTMNVYANEQWLKDANGVQLMQLLLALAKVSANDQGRAQIITVLQSVIDQALKNGTISVGKQLTPVQKAFISQNTGDPDAWRQVQVIGYWLDCVISSTVVSGVTKYSGDYTLIYSKDDTLSKINGTHILI